MLEPTQADREAAQALCVSGWTYAIEAFTLHRQATEQAIIAWLNDMKREDTNWPQVIARMIEQGQHRG